MMMDSIMSVPQTDKHSPVASERRLGLACQWALTAISLLLWLTTNRADLVGGSPNRVDTLHQHVGRWLQTDWSGGPGQVAWSEDDPTAYAVADSVDSRAAGQVGLGYTLPHTSTGDLNQDGYPDIVFANWLDQYPPQHHDVESYVYWGRPDGFSNQRRTGLPTRGAVGVSVADLDNDGFLDLVFSNQRGGYYDGPDYTIDSYIYWGGPGGYLVSRRTGLPTLGSMSNAIADLNGDGYLDIVFANSTDGTTVDVDSYIYWGGPGGYSLANRTGLPVRRAVGVSAIDLNQDGMLDLIFSNTTDGRSAEIESYIYWGGPEGYSPARRTGLPTSGAYDNTAADLNGDGHLDLVFGNRYRYIGGVPFFEVDSYIYWGSAAGYRPEARTELPTVGAVGVSVADLDDDGYPDMIFSNGSDNDSYIYWGNAAAAYGVSERSSLPAYGSLGNSVADLNGDGHLDLVFSSDWNGFVYWGDGSRAYSSQRLDMVQTVSSLSNAVAGARMATAGSSMGTVYTRPIADGVTMAEALTVPRIYAVTGHLDSSAFHALADSLWLTLSWQAQVPRGTGLTIALSTSDDGTVWSDGQTVAEVASTGTGSADLTGLISPSRYLRYRVVLTSSPDHQQTPWLQAVAVDYELLEPMITPTSSPTATGSPTPSPSATPSPSPTATKTCTPSPTGTTTPTAAATVVYEQYLPLLRKIG